MLPICLTADSIGERLDSTNRRGTLACFETLLAPFSTVCDESGQSEIQVSASGHDLAAERGGWREDPAERRYVPRLRFGNQFKEYREQRWLGFAFRYFVARTMATMPALIAWGRAGQAAMTVAKSGPESPARAIRAPDFAPL
jgi:hypothetical protein